MVKLLIRAGVVILAVSGAHIGAAQTPSDIITIAPGVEQRLAIKNVDGASVGNINVIHIQRLTPNEVIIASTGIGETSLELSHRTGEKKTLTIRVARAAQTRVRISAKPADQALIGPDPIAEKQVPIRGADLQASSKPSSVARVAEEPKNIASATIKTDSSNAPGSSPSNPPAAPSPAIHPPAIQRPVEKQSFASRFQVSAETVFLFDKEQIRMVSTEFLNTLKAPPPVSPDSLGPLSQTDQVMTVRRSSIVTPISVLYEINPRNTLTVILPYIRRQDEITVGENSFKTKGQGLGDVQVRFDRSFPNLLKSPWEGSVAFDLGLPTGKSIYNTTNNESPLGTGHYELGTTLGVYRIFDPFTFNAAIGANYSVPRVVEGNRISPGLGFSLQTGIGFALSDRWVLSEQLNYRRQPNAFLSTPIDNQTVSINQSSLTHSLNYSPTGDHGLRMMFNLGLNPGSPDYGFGVTYSYRRKTKVLQ